MYVQKVLQNKQTVYESPKPPLNIHKLQIRLVCILLLLSYSTWVRLPSQLHYHRHKISEEPRNGTKLNKTNILNSFCTHLRNCIWSIGDFINQSCDLLKKKKREKKTYRLLSFKVFFFSGRQGRWRDLFKYNGKAFPQDPNTRLLHTVQDSSARNRAGMAEKAAVLHFWEIIQHLTTFSHCFISYRKCF